MILSGGAIKSAVARGDIVIDPFNEKQLGPNSYDFRLGDRCKIYSQPILDAARKNEVTEISIPTDGLLLTPGRVYLVNTFEVMGSSCFVPIIRGRSSTGRLGLFIDVTADLIDLGSVNQWTLQLVPVLPIRVFPQMLVGQVTFWVVQGRARTYSGKYGQHQSPIESLSYLDFQNGD